MAQQLSSDDITQVPVFGTAPDRIASQLDMDGNDADTTCDNDATDTSKMDCFQLEAQAANAPLFQAATGDNSDDGMAITATYDVSAATHLQPIVALLFV